MVRIDLLERLANPLASRHRGVTILDDSDRYIIDFGEPIYESSANELLDRIHDALGDRKILFLQGVVPNLQPSPIYGDEEPF